MVNTKRIVNLIMATSMSAYEKHQIVSRLCYDEMPESDVLSIIDNIPDPQTKYWIMSEI